MGKEHNPFGEWIEANLDEQALNSGLKVSFEPSPLDRKDLEEVREEVRIYHILEDLNLVGEEGAYDVMHWFIGVADTAADYHRGEPVGFDLAMELIDEAEKAEESFVQIAMVNKAIANLVVERMIGEEREGRTEGRTEGGEILKYWMNQVTGFGDPKLCKILSHLYLYANEKLARE